MANERVDIFAEADIDLGKFKPKDDDQPKRPAPEAFAGIGEGKFVSREPAKTAKPLVKKPYRYRTGRDRQLNVRASSKTIDGYTALAETLNCSVAELIERALSALQREVEHSGREGER